MLHKSQLRHTAARRGGILITTLIISTIVASMLAGLGCLLTSYYSRAQDETSYSSSIDLADAGANYEIRRITANAANADLPGTNLPPGTTVAFGNGSFRVYCTMADGITAWDRSTTPFCIISTGISGAVSRSIKISATSTAGSLGSTALFAVTGGTANGNPTINGDLATDGTLTFNGGPTVTGKVIFDGSGAGWNPNPKGSWAAVATNVNSVTWPTVSQVALSLFPNSGATAPGGLAYLAIHNDNALAIPPIVGNTISLSGHSSITLVGKPGGSNYYLTSTDASGDTSVVFNNTLGPITIWQGPAGGGGGFTLDGGAASVKLSADPTKAVRIYVATSGGLTLNGNSELDAGVYSVTGAGSNVTINGTGDLYGSVICDTFTFDGTPQLHGTSGYFTAPGGAFQFNNSWAETNGM